MQHIRYLVLGTLALLVGGQAVSAQRWSSRDDAARAAHVLEEQARRFHQFTQDRPGLTHLRRSAQNLAQWARHFHRSLERGTNYRDARQDFAELQRAYVQVRQALRAGEEAAPILNGRSAAMPVSFTVGRGRIGIYQDGTFLLDSNGNGVWDEGDSALPFGQAGDIPVTGDWNGDGNVKIGVFRNGTWLLDYNGSGVWDEDGDATYSFGQKGDIPIAGDWNGDGVTKIGVFRRGTFLLDYNGSGTWDEGDVRLSFGETGDWPVVGDWTGDGRARIGVFRKGQFLLDVNGNGSWDRRDLTYRFGQDGDIPVVGDWTGDGVTKVGVFRDGTFLLDTNGNGAWDGRDRSFDFIRRLARSAPGMRGRDPLDRVWEPVRSAFARVRQEMGASSR